MPKRQIGVCILAATAALCSGLSSASTACEPPGEFTAVYETTMDKVISLEGKGTQSLKKIAPDRYRFSFDVESSVADMHESVEFTWSSEHCGIFPVRYKNQLKGFLIRDRLTEFELNDSNHFAGTYKGKAFSIPARSHYVDPLGLQVQVREDLKSGKSEMTYHMIHKGKVLIDRYRVVGEEILAVDGADLNTLKIEKVRPESSDRETYLWMAPDLDYTLVRILHQEPDGERYEVSLSRLN